MKRDIFYITDLSIIINCIIICNHLLTTFINGYRINIILFKFKLAFLASLEIMYSDLYYT